MKAVKITIADRVQLVVDSEVKDQGIVSELYDLGVTGKIAIVKRADGTVFKAKVEDLEICKPTEKKVSKTEIRDAFKKISDPSRIENEFKKGIHKKVDPMNVVALMLSIKIAEHLLIEELFGDD